MVERLCRPAFSFHGLTIIRQIDPTYEVHTLHIKYTGRQPFAVRTVNGLFLSVTTYFLPFIFITIIGEIKADKTTSIHVFPVKML